MLRSTIAVVAAGLGGADAITVLPFTAALGLPDGFARRIARNTQLILLEESNLAKVSDPAAGSGGIEDLTEQLCAAAWTLFQEIESAGGAAAALEQSLIQDKVAATRAEREKNVARRSDALTGTSEFPDIHEAAGARARRRTRIRAARETQPPSFAALPRIRLAAAVRGAARCIRPRAWRRPARGQESSSPISARPPTSPRARCSRRISSRPAASRRCRTTASPAATPWWRVQGVRREARLPVLVRRGLCDRGGRRREGAGGGRRTHIYLAGRPGEIEPTLKAAGVQDFIYAGCDVLAVLQQAHRELGS